MTYPSYEFFATCAQGLESELARELKKLNINRIRPLHGGVCFFGTLKAGYKACLWSRTASRILLILDRVNASNAETLYDGVQQTAWMQHIEEGATLAIHAHGQNDELRNSQFTAMRVKDAICDQLLEERGNRPNISPKRPSVLIDVAIRRNKATIALDLSGEALHRRAYRLDKVQSEAPLKETLAAGILLSAGWDEQALEHKAFVDPMCGSGTLAIEAAALATNQAPGLLRDYWGFLGWRGHDADLWDDLIAEADELFEEGLAAKPLIFASDIDESCVELARENARRAGLESCIHFGCGDVAELKSMLKPSFIKRGGLVALNPPYGERLSSIAQLPLLYGKLAQGVSCLKHGWNMAIISPDEGIDDFLGLSTFNERALFNGALEVKLKQYRLKETEQKRVHLISLQGHEMDVAVSDLNAEQFASRLRKVAKERLKWARRHNIQCVRLYDHDLPDYAVSIDWYQGVGRDKDSSCVRIAEYAAPKEIDPARAQARFRDVLALTPCVLDIDAAQVFAKTRRREQGGSQYKEARGKTHPFITAEEGLRIEADMDSYLDTGIFLDHRITRSAIQRLAEGKHFLNLFSYTGVATVHAMAGGARSSISVDLSQTYLAWAQRNLTANRLMKQGCELVRHDVMPWITATRRTPVRFDLIFVDPPTFSNSKAMGHKTWSVQRDHVELLIGCSRLLRSGGVGIFSCNLRGFKPDTETLARYGVSLLDITDLTIPVDFERNKKIHRCYLFAKQGEEALFEPVAQVFKQVYSEQRQ